MPAFARVPDVVTRFVLGLLVLVWVLGAGAVVTASTARAATHTQGPIAVSLHSLGPDTLSAGQDLTVTATVRNAGSANLSGANASLALGSQALDSLSQQQEWEGSTRSLTSSKTTTTGVPDLAPGASADVTLTLPASDIDVSFSMTTLPVEVRVTGNESGSTAQGSIRTTVPWTTSGGSYTKINGQLVVPISLPADPSLFSTSGSARFRAWNKAIGPGSAIDKLLSANPSVPVTWLIDPTVLDPPTAQDGTLPATSTLAGNGADNPANGASPSSSPAPSGSSGASSGASSSEASPSSGASSSGQDNAPQQLTTVDELAARLRSKLEKRPQSQQVWFTPYGDPDLSTLTSARRPANADALLRRMLARELPRSLTNISSDVVAAPVAPLDAASAERLDNAWKATRATLPTIVTPDATLDGDASASVSSAARRTTSGQTVLGVDAPLSETLSSTSMSDAEAGVELRSRSLAIYQQQPSTSRSLVVMASRATISSSRLDTIANSLKNVPWMEPTATDLSASTTKASTARFQTMPPADAGVWPRPSSSALSSQDVSSLTTSTAHLGRYAGIVDNGDDIVPAWGRSLDQIASTRWRGHPSAVRSLVDSSSATVESIPGRVGVLPSGTINFFTDSGRITVTVRNDLARTVSGVQLHLKPRSYAVRFTAQPEPVSIEAGSRAGLRVPTAAMAAGSVDVLATATARNGVELGGGSGDPVRFAINARPTGTWIYWALGIVALLVFCYGLARNRKKGTRRRDELARDIQL